MHPQQQARLQPDRQTGRRTQSGSALLVVVLGLVGNSAKQIIKRHILQNCSGRRTESHRCKHRSYYYFLCVCSNGQGKQNLTFVLFLSD